MADNAVDCLIVHAELVEVRREAAAESVPAVPGGKGIVALEYVAFGFVFFLGLPADRAARKRRRDHAPHKIIEVERLSVPCLEDRPDGKLTHAQLVGVE